MLGAMLPLHVPDTGHWFLAALFDAILILLERTSEQWLSDLVPRAKSLQEGQGYARLNFALCQHATQGEQDTIGDQIGRFANFLRAVWPSQLQVQKCEEAAHVAQAAILSA